METANYAAGKALSVTVVGTSQEPFQNSLGPRIGAMFRKVCILLPTL